MITALPFIVAVLVTVAKCLSLALTKQWLLAVGWLGVGFWIVLIGYTYWKKLDLPMVGPADYRDGKNQFGRTCAAFGMTLIYMIAAISDR